MAEIALPSPLARHQVEAILYLADRIAFTDRNISSTEKGAIQLLAAQANQPQFRDQPWYQHFTDDAACDRLDTPEARIGALVVLRYVVRSDARVEAAEGEFFQQILERLHVDAVQIPKDINHHQKLALAYLGKV
jgi:hypothetical protein